MNVLCDYQHSDLLYSMQRTFEDEQGYSLFVPMGHEWWDERIWRFGEVYGDDRLALQFLSPRGTEVEPGLWMFFDEHHPERPIYGVSLERAGIMPWHAVVATVDENQRGFARYARDHDAEYLYHIGNANQYIDFDLKPVLLQGPQRFDHETTFRYRPPVRRDRIVSFMNLLALVPESWEGFGGLRNRLPDFTFASYGHHCPDGFLKPVAAIAEEMSRAGWGYHDKPTGDGFGHILANWAAVGRPLIGHGRYYEGQWGERFWEDGVTCIDLDRHSLDEAARIIEDTDEDEHDQMCQTIRLRLEDALSLVPA